MEDTTTLLLEESGGTPENGGQPREPWKRTFAAALAGLAGIVVSSPALAVPVPDFDLLGDTQIVVSWSETEGIVEVETSLDLEHWLTLPAPPTVIDGRVRIVTALFPEERFFRLRSHAALYVVNQQDDFVGFSDFETAEGNVAPSLRLTRGVATNLTQPRATAVTRTGRLLISRGSGGIVGWNAVTEATGSTPADLEVDGANTHLDEPIAFAYDSDADRLYVGNTQADMAILVFDDVSAAGFDGNLAPDRTFGPDDRFPNAGAGTIRMTIDSFKLTDDGTLYVVDTSGLSQNSSRILVYNNPGPANGQTNPARTITGPWTKLRSIEIVNNRLYAVDDSNVLFVVDSIGSASGTVTPHEVTVTGSAVGLRAVIAFDQQLYFLDENNASILAVAGIPDGSQSSVTPDRVIDGSATRLRLPSYMYITRGFLEP